MEGQLPEKIKKERLQDLMKAVEETAGKRNQRFKDTELEVLVEQKREDKLSGRTRGNTLVKFKCDKDLIGKLAKVRITVQEAFVLEGELVS
jgi:tRNA-2-methylthio-N6-dimethylallyladenosine synthase